MKVACILEQDTYNALAQGPGGSSPGPAGATGYTAGNNGER